MDLSKLIPGKKKNARGLAAKKAHSNDAYFELLLRSINEPVIDGVQMPGFPSPELQLRFVGSSNETALREGFRFYRVVVDYCELTGNPLNQGLHILDFGCGWGRMSRFFARTVASENFFGVDVDPEVISFCSQNMHYGNYTTVEPLPPTEFKAGSMDVIIAYSVFSHLAEVAAKAWIDEFSRILKPGGILLATTQGRAFLDLCESLQGKTHGQLWHNKLAKSFVPIDQAKESYDNGKFLFEPTGMDDRSSVRNNSYYGEALIPRAYIEREYTTTLDLVDFVMPQTKLPQALFVMQKPK